jgi:hypothetical protein
MRKGSYFDELIGSAWPSPNEIEHYFLSASGRRQAFDTDNDCWGFSAEGVDGSEHLPDNEGRPHAVTCICACERDGVDISETFVVNSRQRVFFAYDRRVEVSSKGYFPRKS